ncbi:site-specific integrase [Enterobacteriaceae bacterium H20N1]|uniref:Site-specific integrase n=1 Tax=Dryocola boscaweniae TaxID=2925397 RepID=A0A9X2W6N0_9ENTR|nr:site-specific integrase [Dryocola boscaweniae]MCT4701951.1 site-specific integrase [Dryocola boscaweniae]MCT4719119.1 site-specific integrase [Dryocola boscaweniae]
MKKYAINSFVFDNGERFCHVVDKITGEPIYYPNLYLITQVRNRSNSINTIQSIAGILAMLHSYFAINNIDIEERIFKLEFLSFNEIEVLSDYMSKNYKQGKGTPSGKLPVAKNPTNYFRFNVICDYMQWLCKVYLTLSNDKNVELKIKNFITAVKSKRPSNIDRYKKEIPDKALNQKQLDYLFDIVKPNSDNNPFSSEVQKRNQLIMLLLYSFGIRAGELLNLRISDIDFAHSTIAIKRRADDKSDPRVNQPLVKTCERKLPVGETLMGEIYNYIIVERNKVKNAKGNDFLFITNKLGKTVGMPLSMSAYHKIINIISKAHPELNELSGHMLRHTWNYEFSRMMDERDEPFSEEKEAQIRSYIMGWVVDSEMAKIYNARHIVEQAHKTSLVIQNEFMERAI